VVRIKDVKAQEFLGVELKENGPKTRSYSERVKQRSLGQSPQHGMIKGSDVAAKERAVAADRSNKVTKTGEPLGAERIKENGPKTRSYFKRMEQEFFVRSPEHGKVTVRDGAAKVEDYSGVAHNKESQTKLEEYVLAADLGNKDAKANEFLAPCVCGSIQFIKILNILKCVQCRGITENLAWSPENVTDRGNKDDNVKEFSSVELNKACEPKTRSHSEQRSLDQSPEHARVKGRDGAAKVEDFSGATHNKEPQNTCAADRINKDVKTKEFLDVELNEQNGPKTRSYSESVKQSPLGRSPQQGMIKGSDVAAKERVVVADRSNKVAKTGEPLGGSSDVAAKEYAVTADRSNKDINAENSLSVNLNKK
jgi:hypothetical protein